MSTMDTIFRNYLNTLKNRKGRIILVVLVFVALSVGITLVMEKEYKATSKVIVTQNLQASSNIYTSRRAAQVATNTLIDIAYSDTFYQKFTKGNARIRAFFPDEVKQRRRQFQRDVVIQSPQDGIITITTFNPQRKLALKENQAALSALQTISDQYFGQSAGITVRTINDPSLYEGVGRPNIWVNMAGGALLGFVISLFQAFFALRRSLRNKEYISDFEAVPTRLKQFS